MLSKPALESSAGRSGAGSISRASRSRIALAYSARFSRCTSGRPGWGDASAARSSCEVSETSRACLSAAGGAGMPGGGIMPARTLRTTFSHVSPWAPTSDRSIFSRTSPPLLARAL